MIHAEGDLGYRRSCSKCKWGSGSYNFQPLDHNREPIEYGSETREYAVACLVYDDALHMLIAHEEGTLEAVRTLYFEKLDARLKVIEADKKRKDQQ